MAIGETFIILLGSIDLSLEGIVAFSAVVVSMMVRNGRNDNDFGWLALFVALGIGGAMGFLNGFIHVRLRIPSFMCTLGMGFVGVGAATVLLSGEPVRVLDENIRGLALNRFLDVPYMVWVGLSWPLLLAFSHVTLAWGVMYIPSAAAKIYWRCPVCPSGATRS